MEIEDLRLEHIFLIIGLGLILYALIFPKGFKAFDLEFPSLEDRKIYAIVIGIILSYIGYKNCNQVTWNMIEEELKNRKIQTYPNFSIIPEILETVERGEEEYQLRLCFNEKGEKIAIPKDFKSCPDKIHSLPNKREKFFLDPSCSIQSLKTIIKNIFD